MSTPIKPLADRVVAVQEKAQEKTASGIFLPESAREKPTLAHVTAIGPDVTSVKVGDMIIYKEYSDETAVLKIEGGEYLLLKEKDILATV